MMASASAAGRRNAAWSSATPDARGSCPVATAVTVSSNDDTCAPFRAVEATSTCGAASTAAGSSRRAPSVAETAALVSALSLSIASNSSASMAAPVSGASSSTARRRESTRPSTPFVAASTAALISLQLGSKYSPHVNAIGGAFHDGAPDASTAQHRASAGRAASHEVSRTPSRAASAPAHSRRNWSTISVSASPYSTRRLSAVSSCGP